MLTPSQIAYVDAGYDVYDHDWRLHGEFLGEPFLLGDCLAYFDGRMLYFCAFRLGNCHKIVSGQAIGEAIAAFPHRRLVRGFDIWGCYEKPAAPLIVDGRNFSEITHEPESEATDLVLDLTRFSYERNTDARLARNSARNKGIVAEIVKPQRFGFEHIALMEHFFATHPIAPNTTEFFGPGVFYFATEI